MRRILGIALLLAMAPVFTAAIAAPAPSASQDKQIFSRPTVGAVSAPALTVDKKAGLSAVWVDDNYSEITLGWGIDHFASIQAGIDAVMAPDGIVNVFPGEYSETAANRLLFDGTGPYQFGLFFGNAMGGVTVQGVDASGIPIASYGDVVANVQCNATNSFGPSGVWVEGNSVTVTGLNLFLPGPAYNKTVEVIGDDFTIRHCKLTDGCSLYFGDWRYGVLAPDESWIKSYTVDGNLFAFGTSLDPNNGAGVSGPASGRLILNNRFELGGGYWNAISFSGSDTGVPWFVYSVGGAVIQGNTFVGGTTQYIRARGTYDNSQFDWASYWADNSFDGAAIAGSSPPGTVTEYSYTSDPYEFNHCRRVGRTIQGEINTALAGNTVHVKAGTYEEQVEIDKNITLVGAGPTTVIQSPLTLAASYVVGTSTKKPIVYVHDTDTAVLRSLTVDGAGRGNLNYSFQGVGFWNAGGALIDCDVLNVSDTPFSGAQHGIGIYANNSTSGPYSLALTNVNVSGFQKNATALLGNGLTVALSNVVATGAGPTTITAQNGIEIADGASGTIVGCAVSGIHWVYPGLGTRWTATGLLLIDAGTVAVSNTTATGCQTGFFFINTSGSASHCTINGDTTTPDGYDGFDIWTDGPGKASAGPRAIASPSETTVAGAGKSAVAVSISDCVFDGGGVDQELDTWGVWAGGGANVGLTMGSNTVTGWDYGVGSYDDYDGHVAAYCQNNRLFGNSMFGFKSTSLLPADARNCWWGSITGPLNAALNPGGLGNEVSDNVLFEPWTGQALLAIAPATSGPLTCAGSQLLAFDYTPDPLSPAVKGYSVTVETSAALTFDDGDVHFTTLPSDATMVNPVVTEVTPGHKYIIDYAVLFPANTGFTGPATLFTINFHAAGEGTGTVHMSDLAFRDVDNVPIPVGAMNDATVTVDCTAPGAVATVTASPGHRLVQVDWTASASTDLAGYEVWRAKWHRTSVAVSAYPEYNDYADNVTPTPPAAYGSWNGGEWVLAATVPAGTLTCTDTGDTNRGVYYYEVFAKDLAGNYSLPAVAIDRATNYWLGDVRHEGTGDYDGIVYIADISSLGAYYGTTVPLLEPVAVAAKVDVGPTDDMSRKGIPTTDSKINFEDLMVFAMNFGSSGPPAKALDPTLGGSVVLTWARLDDLTWSLCLDGPCGGLRGVNVSATLPQGVTARVEPGALIAGQSDPTFVKNIGANGLDAGLALLGTNIRRSPGRANCCALRCRPAVTLPNSPSPPAASPMRILARP